MRRIDKIRKLTFRQLAEFNLTFYHQCVEHYNNKGAVVSVTYIPSYQTSDMSVFENYDEAIKHEKCWLEEEIGDNELFNL